MLDLNRLSSIPLLCKSGWRQTHRINIEKRYAEIELYYKKHPYSYTPPQVPLENVFPAAREIVESLDGICIKNLHPELGLGTTCDAIEFNFFEYDNSNFPELQIICAQIEKQALFIGIGYDIIGDWLVDEDRRIYFRDKIRNRLHWVSRNIYQFLERDIYKLTDMNGISIFSE